ncbi:MAG: baseplate J/gp47 family protein, partial [Aeromonas veronii]
EGNGVVSEGQCKIVDAYLWPRRPVTDRVLVKSAEITEYTVRATLFQAKNPDSEAVMEQARASLTQFVNLQHRFKAKITTSALHAILMVYGVTEVRLEGWTDIFCDAIEAPYCTGMELTFGGWDDEAVR